jgi:hypothetical protein
MKSGVCYLLGQGLRPVTVRQFKASAPKFKKLKAALAMIPSAWSPASYSGYNFVTDAESATASEVAVLGKKSGTSLPGYFVPATGSEVENLVKQIARIDA